MMDLEKGKEALKLHLKKYNIVMAPSAELAFVLDVSGSFNESHRDGSTQTLLERLVPWGMLFDPDQRLDIFTFSSGKNNAHHVGDISPQTCANYVNDKIVDKVPGYGAGTDYGYVLEEVLKNFGWLEPRGFFGKLFGGAEKQKRKSIVLFVTDGVNDDRGHCMDVLAESEKRGDQVYFLFIGIGGPFPFLKNIADKYNNTGLVVIENLREFVACDDEHVNERLIGTELVTWLKK